MKARLVKFGEIQVDKEGPGIRHPALHVLTGDLGDRISLKAWRSSHYWWIVSQPFS
jgi:hypothetical protein